MSSAHDLILAEGDESRKLNERKAGRKVRFLKSGQSFRGRFITTKFSTFAQHGDFEKRIQSHACLDPKNRKDCVSCAAGVKRTNKTIVPWYDIDTGEIVVRDMSRTAMATIYAAVDQYGEDLTTDTFQVAMGDKGAVGVMYIKPKKGEEFPQTPEDVVIDEDLLTYVMNVKTPDEIRELIGGKADASGDGVKIEESNGVSADHAPGPVENGKEMF